MGRPRSEEARQAALTATVDLLLEHGIEAVAFEDVAARSGVAKSTLYRHFGSKHGMIAAAVRSTLVEAPTPDTGDLAADLTAIFVHAEQIDAEHRTGEVMAALLAASERDDELRRNLLAMREERRRPVRTVLQLAQLRGEISRDLDLEFAIALLIGPFVQRRLIDRVEVTREFRTAVIDHVVVALRALADGGPSPSRPDAAVGSGVV
jgi:AcrR family transcriptional regulator